MESIGFGFAKSSHGDAVLLVALVVAPSTRNRESGAFDGVHLVSVPKLESRMLLPLDSPHWNDLTACYSSVRAIELLRQIVSTGRLGEAWRGLHDEIIHQGSAASAGFVVTASLADANLRIWQPSSNVFSLVPLQSAPQWLSFTGDILSVGLTTGAVSFSLR